MHLRSGGTDTLLGLMDAADVDRVLLVNVPETNRATPGTPFCDSHALGQLGDDQALLEAAQQEHPERLAPLGGGGSLGPLIQCTDPDDADDVLDAFRERAEQLIATPGFAGFGEMVSLHLCMSDTHHAGERAGLAVERLVNEPTAAALAHAHGQLVDRNVLLYDLGGGTFDASLVHQDGEVVEVLASHGDSRLGGDDIDLALLDHVLGRLADEDRDTRRALERSVIGRHKLRVAVEQAEIALSQATQTTVRVPFAVEEGDRPRHVALELRRDELEEVSLPWLERALPSVDRVLQDSGLGPDQSDELLLVGGATLQPLLWHLLHRRFGLEGSHAIPPRRAAVTGAAIQAAIVDGSRTDGILVDVAPYSLSAGSLLAEDHPFGVPASAAGCSPRATARCRLATLRSSTRCPPTSDSSRSRSSRAWTVSTGRISSPASSAPADGLRLSSLRDQDDRQGRRGGFTGRQLGRRDHRSAAAGGARCLRGVVQDLSPYGSPYGDTGVYGAMVDVVTVDGLRTCQALSVQRSSRAVNEASKAGRSEVAVSQMISGSSSKYAWTMRFRMPLISAHGTSGARLRTSSGRAAAASPMTNRLNATERSRLGSSASAPGTVPATSS